MAIVLAWTTTPAAGWLGRRIDLVDRPTGDELKIHPNPVPVLGGLAVVSSLLAAQVGSHVGWQILVGIVAGLVVGVADDIRSRPAWMRLGLQAMIGVLLTTSITPFSWLGLATIVALTMCCTNAANLMDGQDGMAGGLTAISALGFSALLALEGDGSGVWFALALGGASLGFLFWNWPPARVFLGNGGAYAVGVALASCALRLIDAAGLRGGIAAALVLGPFTFELAGTFLRRTIAGGSFTTGDRRHSYDLLARGPGGRTHSTLLLWMAGAVCVAGSLAILRVPQTFALALLTLVASAALAIGWRLWGQRGTSSTVYELRPPNDGDTTAAP